MTIILCRLYKTTMSFFTVFAFLMFDHGARALIANYRGQTGRRLVSTVSSVGPLTHEVGKLSWVNTLDWTLKRTNLSSNY